jgi:hypothetical protein
MAMSDTKLSVAYHEAGHAVIGLRLGFEIEYAELCKEAPIKLQGKLYGDWSDWGRVKWRDPRWKLQQDNRSIRSIKAAQAGEIAQGLCADPFKKQPEWSKDRRYIRRDARKACKGDQAKADALIEQLHRGTEKLVRENRGAIERVALALMERGYLTGDQIKGLLGEREWSSPTLDEMPFAPALRELYEQRGVRRW